MSSASSIKPYLIRAVYEWCIDNGHCPYISVLEEGCSGVSIELFENGKVTLNISSQSVTDLLIDNEIIQFVTRFNGVSKKVSIMLGAVVAIFSRESGQGLTFAPEINIEPNDENNTDDSVLPKEQPSSHYLPPTGKAILKVIK